MITNSHARLRAYSTTKRAKLWIFFSFIFWLIAGCHIPIMVTINSGLCTVFGIYGTIFSVYVILGIGLLPPITSAIFGYLAYRNMRLRRIQVQPIGHGTNEESYNAQRRDRNLLIIVMPEVILYVLTTSLYPTILAEMTITRYLIPNKSSQQSQMEGFIFTIATLLAYSNHGASFYVYLISSKSFRRDFKRLIVSFYRKARGLTSVEDIARTNQTRTQQETRV